MNKLDEYKTYRATTKNPLNYMAWCNWQFIVKKSQEARVKEV